MKMKKQPKKIALTPLCPYCGQFSKLVKGDVIYPHRRDLYSMSFYLCSPCDAYVGCHGETVNPLGRLANAELRNAKKSVHAVFDPIWKNRFEQKNAIDPTYKKAQARGGRYKKLAELLGIPVKDCHIGMFDIETCNRAIQFCQSGQLTD